MRVVKRKQKMSDDFSVKNVYCNKSNDVQSKTEYEDELVTQKSFGNINNQQNDGQKKTKRKLHRAFTKAWSENIEKNGFAKCIICTCNFISSCVTTLQDHHRICNGVPVYDRNFCNNCNSYLISSQEFLDHRRICKSEDSSIDFRLNDSEFEKEGVEVIGERLNNKEDFSFEGNTFSSIAGDLNSFHKPNTIELYHCLYCRVSFSTREEYSNHLTLCENEESNQLENDEDHIAQDSIAAFKRDKHSGSQSLEKLDDCEIAAQLKKQNRKSGKKLDETEEKIKCGKCDFEGTPLTFKDHNFKVHVGLGWIEGEKAIDLSDEKEVTRLVKEAFKVTKKGTCEICQVIKRSFMGFVSHIQNCGKTDEEREAFKVECPHCFGKYLKYSLPVHIKISHSNTQQEDKIVETEEEPLNDCKRRQSAVRAVQKVRKALGENGEEEVRESAYSFYKKSDGKVPKLCTKLCNIWYKLKRARKKIPCRHANCQNLSDDVREAKEHHFKCSQFPDEVFYCETCEFYSVDEPSIQSHVSTHRRTTKQKNLSRDVKSGSENEEEDYKVEDEDQNEDCYEEDQRLVDDSNLNKKRKRKQTEDETCEEKKKAMKLSNVVEKPDVHDEIYHRLSFCRRENLENIRGVDFYSHALEMTLKEEELETILPWDELHTEVEDWIAVSPCVVESILPELTKSVPVSFANDKKWRQFNRFEGGLINDTPVMFVGGSVRAMSWNRVSFKRTSEGPVKQYLALTTSRNFDYLTNIQERSENLKTTLLQIWDCGALENAPAKDVPKFCLGIIQEGGEIWDLSWFSEDSFAEGSNGMIRRLGLLVTSSEDGIVRVWSVCDPTQLPSNHGLPIYTSEPVVKLVTDDDLVDSCVRLSVGREGIVAGGYANGILAIWNVKNISSPFSKRQRKCTIVKAYLTIQAHRTLITAISFCPINNRYISTGALDRIVKLWDLKCPLVPLEQQSKELCVDSIWMKHWPLLIYNFDDVINNINKGLLKFINGILAEKNQSCLVVENMCLSLSFSDWLNTICGCNNEGDIKVRLLKNFMHDQKVNEKAQINVSSIKLEKINEDENTKTKNTANSISESVELNSDNNLPLTYDKISAKYGLLFEDRTSSKVRTKNKKNSFENVPIKAVNKVCFNPNFKSFTHLAAGYNCGLVRIFSLKELQSNKYLKFFVTGNQARKM